MAVLSNLLFKCRLMNRIIMRINVGIMTKIEKVKCRKGVGKVVNQILGKRVWLNKEKLRKIRVKIKLNQKITKIKQI